MRAIPTSLSQRILTASSVLPPILDRNRDAATDEEEVVYRREEVTHGPGSQMV